MFKIPRSITVFTPVLSFFLLHPTVGHGVVCCVLLTVRRRAMQLEARGPECGCAGPRAVCHPRRQTHTHSRVQVAQREVRLHIVSCQ